MRLLLICFVSFLLVWCSVSPSSPTWSPETWSGSQVAQELPKVCYGETCWWVEIADEPEEQKQGLMNRKELPTTQWMLFIFPKTAAWPFWMKNTLIPLDMIWLDDTGKVVYLHRRASPCTEWDACPWYGPKEPVARYVLEINAGQADVEGISLGSQLVLPKN